MRLLARQAPVATELRLVVSAMDAVSHLLQMGKLAGHIAKITRGSIVHLPAREAAILEVLMRHAGRVVSPRERCTAIGPTARTTSRDGSVVSPAD